jgi:nucleotide-binding universal stress UspA family protein
VAIIVGYTPSPEGRAALDHAVEEATTHGQPLVVVNVSAASDPHEKTFASEEELAKVTSTLDAAGVSFTVRQLVRGKEPSQEIVDLAAEIGASLIVIGLRHRTPVGKLLLGSTSQQILLDAACPVLAVKAPR